MLTRAENDSTVERCLHQAALDYTSPPQTVGVGGSELPARAEVGSGTRREVY